MASASTNKPLYGPSMTPEIFATKWLAKCNTFLWTKHLTSNKSTPLWICVLVTEGFDFLQNFRDQAVELGVSRSDFPDRPPERPPSRGFESQAELSTLLINPFVSATGIQSLVDSYLKKLQQMKLGGALCGLRWQQLPLEQRKGINEVLLAVEEAREEGWWDPPPDPMACGDF